MTIDLILARTWPTQEPYKASFYCCACEFRRADIQTQHSISYNGQRKPLVTNFQTNGAPLTRHDNIPVSIVLLAIKAPSNAMVHNIQNTRSQRMIQMKISTTKCQKMNPGRPCRLGREIGSQSRSLQGSPRCTNALLCVGTRYIGHTITKGYPTA